MADTLPNIVVEPKTVVDLYSASGITIGVRLNIAMIGTGSAKLFAGAALAGEPTNATGYREIKEGDEFITNQGESGAFIWSRYGCTINVGEA